MTFVGKILVILIMAFSLVFLGVSVVTFTTAANWKEKSTQQAEQIKKVTGQLNDAKAKLATAEGELKKAKDEHAVALKGRDDQIADRDAKATAATADMTASRLELETAQQNAKVSLAEATTRKGEIDVLNATLSKAQEQANQFSKQNIELTDNVRVLEREKATAEQNAKDLRSFVGRTMAYLRLKGIPMENIDRLDPDKAPPEAVEGKVVELDATKRSMEISIGQDDGLNVGQELYLYRLEPKAEFIGKVRIKTVYPDQAVVELIGNTVNGKKAQEGDIVSSTFFRSR